MISVLEQMGVKPPGATAKKTRQVTLETAFSRIGSRKASETFKDSSSTPPSMTTGTSNADNSSELNDDSTKLGDSRRDSRRAQASNNSDTERPFSARSVSSHKDMHMWRSRNVSGVTTLVDAKSDVSGRLLQDSVQALNEDWDIGPMPGDDLQLSPTKTVKTSRTAIFRTSARESSRRIIMDKTSTVVGKTTRVLGKRARETVENGKDQAAALYGMTSSRLRSRVPKNQMAAVDAPISKKTRLSENRTKEISPELAIAKKTTQSLTKTWLEHGLYVGQDRDFDPRLTEAQNKKKNAHKSLERKPLMPLPMYSGQKALEKGRNFRLPFLVFSPLPPGQPKPDEWKKTQKNVFIGDAANVWKKGKKLEDSVCDCTPQDGCDEQCFNRSMLYECDNKNCNLGKDRCTNRSFTDLKERLKAGGKYNVGVEVLKTVDRGYGIRANRSFAPNQIIVEYTGEIITKEECDSRMRGRYKDAECYYLMDFDQSMILDATRGSIARFVNHSCSPNCRMAKWTVQGVPRMALFAGDNGIMTGEELTYDYNFNPFSVKNIQECRCGSDNCRGVLGPKPKEAKEREIREALNPIANGGKRKIQQMAEDAIEGVRNATKKRKLDIPVPTSIKNAMMRSQIGIISKPNQLEKERPKETIKGKESSKPKKGAKPKLPIGWVYTEELEEPPPPKIRNIFAQDPEALMRSQKRKMKEVSEEANVAPKKRRITSNEILVDLNSGWRSSENVKNEAEVDDENVEAEGDEGQPLSGRDNVKTKAKSLKKSIVRTMKGRHGHTPGTPGRKSIRVIDDDEGDGYAEIE